MLLVPLGHIRIMLRLFWDPALSQAPLVLALALFPTPADAPPPPTPTPPPTHTSLRLPARKFLKERGAACYNQILMYHVTQSLPGGLAGKEQLY